MGRRDPDPEKIVRGLGWFSVGLGAAQLLAPAAIDRLIGIAPTRRSRATMRAIGVQEVGVGVALLSGVSPHTTLWSRVWGDLLHVGMLAAAARDPEQHDPRRAVAAMTAVLGVGVVDLFAARRTRPTTRNDGRHRASATVTIRAEPQTVYAYWRELERLPTFMAHVRSVERTGDGHSHWVVEGPAGAAVEWDAELEEDAPGELLVWRSVPGSQVPNTGRVRFAAAPADRGTEVSVVLEFDPPAGSAGALVAKLLGEHPAEQVRDDLRRLKQILETGEVVRSDGTPDGVRSRRMVAQRTAQPPA